MGKMHKADYKRKVNHYIGFGQYEQVPTSLCGGPEAYYAKKAMCICRLWQNVTCKHCLNRKK